MLHSIHPAPEGDEPAGADSWDSPFKGEQPEVEAATPAEPEKPKPEQETPATGKEPEPETPAKEPEVAVPQTVDLDGVSYTLDEIREFRKGSMLERDYTRKTQRLADERRVFEDERRRAQAATPPKREPPEATDTDLDDPEIPEPVRQAILADRADRRNLRAELDRREREQGQREFQERTWETFDKTFQACCKKNNVTDPLEQEMLHAVILRADPDFEDFDDLASKVELLFDEKNRAYQARLSKAADARLAGIRKAPAAPTPKGGVTVAAKGAPKPEPKGFDVEPSVEEFEEILAQQRRSGTL